VYEKFGQSKRREDKTMIRKQFAKFTGVIAGIVIFAFSFNPSTAISASVPGVTDDSILIGMTYPSTGSAALFAKIGEINEAIFLEWGKNIHGRNIKVISYDDGCDPVKGVAAAKKDIYEDKVFMLNASPCSNVTLAIVPIVEKTGTPLMVAGAMADKIFDPLVKVIFTPTYSSTYAVRTLGDFGMTIPNVKRIGIIRHSDEWAMAQYTALIPYLKEKYNMTPVVDLIAEKGVGDVTPQVLKLKSENLDVVFHLLYPAETTAFLRDAYKLGLNMPLIGSSATNVTDQYDALKSFEPIKKYFTTYPIRYPMDHPKVKVYEELFKKYQPGKKFDAITINNTGGPLVTIDALKKCGRDLTQEKFVEILETQYTNWGPDNYIGSDPITFSKTDHIGMKRLGMATMGTGKFEVVKTYQDYEELMKK
jgi:branched-chain amino acid transport system substrate-binding protein